MPKRLTSDQGGHYGNRPIKADEGTNGDSRLREYGSHLLANVLRRPRICMRESFFANFPTQDHQILFELGILVCYTNIIIRFNFLNPNSDRKWPNLAFLLLPIYSRFGKAPPHWRSTRRLVCLCRGTLIQTRLNCTNFTLRRRRPSLLGTNSSSRIDSKIEIASMGVRGGRGHFLPRVIGVVGCWLLLWSSRPIPLLPAVI